MRKRDAIKQGHEKAVGDQLLGVLRINATYERNGNPNENEPDVVYTISRKTVGIEVATAYYENSDARDEWTLATGEREFPRAGYEERSSGVLFNPDQLICERLQAEINEKCGKKYGGVEEIWLCIEQRAPLSDAKSVADCIRTLKLPAEHQFARIYITYHEGGDYRTIQIW